MEIDIETLAEKRPNHRLKIKIKKKNKRNSAWRNYDLNNYNGP